MPMKLPRDSKTLREDVRRNCDQLWFYWRIVTLFQGMSKLTQRIEKLEKQGRRKHGNERK